MAEFLTTKAIAYKLEDIIKRTTKHLYIVTPYLKLSETFYERLSEAIETGIDCSIVYGKSELTKREDNLLKGLNCNLYFKQNLHGKCYANENTALITSMNLHEFSEVNNREFGVLISKKHDKPAYFDCIKELESVISKSATIKLVSKRNLLVRVTPLESSYDYSVYINHWKEQLAKRFPNAYFNVSKDEPTYLFSNQLIAKDIDFSTKYGFVTLNIKRNIDYLSNIREQEKHRLQNLFTDYRLYWSSADQISLYHAKGISFNNVAEDMKYCLEGLERLIVEVKKIYSI